MNKLFPSKKMMHKPLLKGGIALALALASWAPAERAEASGIPVVDFSAIFQSAQQFYERTQNWFETQAHYASVMKHYADQVAFWQQQLVKIQGLQYELFKIDQQYKPIEENYGVEERCPGVNPGILGSITNSLTSALPNVLNMDGNISDKQNQICAQLVVADNKKYNFTVKYFDELTKETNSLVALQQLRITSIDQSPGNMQALAGDTARFQANITSAKSTWEAQLSQQDAEIDLLKKQQSILTRRAINGKPSLLGELVGAAVLKGAFSVGK
jgi:hypothetical protein